MEPNMQNPEDESELMRRMRELDGLPPEEQGLSKKRKIQLVGIAIALMLLLGAIFFMMGQRAPAKDSKAIPAINRGLSQAETIRKQKELFDQRPSSKKGKDEDWTKRAPILRDHPAPADSSVLAPDPIAVASDGVSPNKESDEPANPADIRPSHTEESSGNFLSKRTGITSTGGRAPLSFLPGASNSMVTVEKPLEFKPRPELAARLTEEYQRALAYLSSEQLVFTRERGNSEGQREKSLGKGIGSSLIVPAISATTHVIISAGQELTAVLNESVNSDYPSVAKATLTSPAELSGATVLLAYNLGNERVTAQITKMILPAKAGEKAKEMTLSAVVKSGLPGLAGDVSHHWTAQIASGLASAGLTAGALAYAAQNSSKDLGTAVLVAPMVEQSVQGILKPINYLGRDRPVTVTVPAGTEFTILVTEGFEVDL